MGLIITDENGNILKPIEQISYQPPEPKPQKPRKKREIEAYTTPEIYPGEPKGLLQWLQKYSMYKDDSKRMAEDILKCGNLVRGIRFSDSPDMDWSPNGYYEVSNQMSREIIK